MNLNGVAHRLSDLRVVSLSGLSKAVLYEVKSDAEIGQHQHLLQQDDDITNVPDPLSNPQSRRTPIEVSYVA